jgi:hypothetical protein
MVSVSRSKRGMGSLGGREMAWLPASVRGMGSVAGDIVVVVVAQEVKEREREIGGGGWLIAFYMSVCHTGS